MQNLGPIYKTKNVYSLMFMLVIIHRAYALKLFLGIIHLDRNHDCQTQSKKEKKCRKLLLNSKLFRTD